MISSVLNAASSAANELFAPRFRSVMFKSIGITILLFVGMWFLAEAALSSFLLPLLPPWPWLTTGIVFLLGAGIFIGAGFLLAPTTAIVAGLFLDDVAEHVEKKYYPEDPAGKAMPIVPSLWLSGKFFLIVVLANLVALLLVLVLGLGVIIFFLVNGYLLGREYFQFAAMRFRGEADASALRKRYSLEVFLGGLLLAGMLSIPILNLFTPVFAAAMMVHLYKELDGERHREPINGS